MQIILRVFQQKTTLTWRTTANIVGAGAQRAGKHEIGKGDYRNPLVGEVFDATRIHQYTLRNYSCLLSRLSSTIPRQIRCSLKNSNGNNAAHSEIYALAGLEGLDSAPNKEYFSSGIIKVPDKNMERTFCSTRRQDDVRIEGKEVRILLQISG